MESITIRVNEDLSREVDDVLSKNYSTKTEFIREAIREKLNSIKKDSVMDELRKYLGSVKTKTSYKEERRIREKAGKEIIEKFGIKLD